MAADDSAAQRSDHDSAVRAESGRWHAILRKRPSHRSARVVPRAEARAPRTSLSAARRTHPLTFAAAWEKAVANPPWRRLHARLEASATLRPSPELAREPWSSNPRVRRGEPALRGRFLRRCRVHAFAPSPRWSRADPPGVRRVRACPSSGRQALSPRSLQLSAIAGGVLGAEQAVADVADRGPEKLPGAARGGVAVHVRIPR